MQNVRHAEGRGDSPRHHGDRSPALRAENRSAAGAIDPGMRRVDRRPRFAMDGVVHSLIKERRAALRRREYPTDLQNVYRLQNETVSPVATATSEGDGRSALLHLVNDADTPLSTSFRGC